MKRMILIAFPLAVLFAATAGTGFDDSYREIDKETFTKDLSFSNPAAEKTLRIDNVNGSIHVTGYDGPTVQVEIKKTIRASSNYDLQRAKQEVELQTSEKDNRIVLYVDGPFRMRDGSQGGNRFKYRVDYDFEVRVPHICNLEVKTVNGGFIRVEHLGGRFDIGNINGKIQMEGIEGSGSVTTINGGIKVLFDRNPARDCSFHTLNGNIDVSFRPGFSADCWFKTFNGAAYTDFDSNPLLQPAAKGERRNGAFAYKSNKRYGARIGDGGPQMNFDTLNGNITVTAR